MNNNTTANTTHKTMSGTKKTKYRMKPSWITYQGIVCYAIQKKMWFGWWTIYNGLRKHEAEATIEELRSFEALAAVKGGTPNNCQRPELCLLTETCIPCEICPNAVKGGTQ
jgi:hypothetical protein